MVKIPTAAQRAISGTAHHPLQVATSSYHMQMEEHEFKISAGGN